MNLSYGKYAEAYLEFQWVEIWLVLVSRHSSFVYLSCLTLLRKALMFLRAASISSSMCSFLVSPLVTELEVGGHPALQHDGSIGSTLGLHLLSHCALVGSIQQGTGTWSLNKHKTPPSSSPSPLFVLNTT